MLLFIFLDNLIPAVIAQFFNPTEELVIPTGGNEVNADFMK